MPQFVISSIWNRVKDAKLSRRDVEAATGGESEIVIAVNADVVQVEGVGVDRGPLLGEHVLLLPVEGRVGQALRKRLSCPDVHRLCRVALAVEER
jgi:hypothetical protein